MRRWILLVLAAGCASGPRPLAVSARATPPAVATQLKAAHYCRHPSSYEGREIYVECSHQAHVTNWEIPVATRSGESMVFVIYHGDRMARVQRVYVHGRLDLARGLYDRLLEAYRGAHGEPSQDAARAHGRPLDGALHWAAWLDRSSGTLHSVFLLEDYRVIEEILSPTSGD